MFDVNAIVMVLSVMASYLFCMYLLRVLVSELGSERKKNEMLIDAIQAKNLTERARKKITERNLDILEDRVKHPKQEKLPGVEEVPEGPPQGFRE